MPQDNDAVALFLCMCHFKDVYLFWSSRYTKSLLFIFSTFTLHFGLVFFFSITVLNYVVFNGVRIQKGAFFGTLTSVPKMLHSSVFPLKPSPSVLFFFSEQTALFLKGLIYLYVLHSASA